MSRQAKRRGRRLDGATAGQSLVEFGLVLPILLLLIIGIAEFGYFVALSSATVSASREAGRYGSSVGEVSPGVPRYVHCAGMRERARNAARPLIELTDAQILITYDDRADGDGTAADDCDATLPDPDPDDVERFDRVIVEVRVSYSPLTPIGEVFFSARDLVHIDRRGIGKES